MGKRRQKKQGPIGPVDAEIKRKETILARLETEISKVRLDADAEIKKIQSEADAEMTNLRRRIDSHRAVIQAIRNGLK